MKKRTGFTLAEVLITLTVIGAMAALTIPSLINNINSAELKVLAKKAYSTVSQAYLMAVSDNGGGFGPYSVKTTISYTKFNAMRSKINVIKECPYGSGSYGNCWAPNGVGSAEITTGCTQWGTSQQNRNYTLITFDGMYIMLYSYDFTLGADILAIDVNGARAPNDWGKDVFTFTINDTSITPRASNCSGNLKHNDGSTVNESEFTAPFIN